MVCLLSNIFSSETTGHFVVKFPVVPPWDGGMKVYSNRPGQLLYMVKPFKNLLLRNKMVDDLENMQH